MDLERKKAGLRPLLGFIQGLLTYLLIEQAHLSKATTAFVLVFFSVPLLGLQVKLPSLKKLPFALASLTALGLIYGYSAYRLVNHQSDFTPILAFQCMISAFIVFVFYAVALEENKRDFPYSSLFTQAWQIVLKLTLGHFLVLLTWGLCFLAAVLFKLLNFHLVSDVVNSLLFIRVMPFFFFGLAMTILAQHEAILTKTRNLLLAFCQFLYPIFVMIGLSFLILIPFSSKAFTDYWQVIIFLSLINLFLFNGIYQAGLKTSPYSSWFTWFIYAFFLILSFYSLYILQFPVKELSHYGLKPLIFLKLLIILLLTAYSLCYSLAIFISQKPWLDLIKQSNVYLALTLALIYLLLTLPGFDLTKRSTKNQMTRILNNQEVCDSKNPGINPIFLVGMNLEQTNLAGKNLSYADFSQANLSGANLSQANLEQANFTGANLIGANLNGANLKSAKFNQSNLTKAKLANANLSQTYFQQTNLSFANLAGANLENTWFYQTIFAKTNFTNANLNNSSGLLQEDLDKACGINVTLPDNLIIKGCVKLKD